MSICKICGSSRVTSSLAIESVPLLCNRLFDTLESALAAETGSIDLHFCRDCGHAFNAAFEPERVTYAPGYENALEFSPRFQRYADELAARLAVRYDLHGKTIVEVGCGRGAFLSSLCVMGGNRGIGYDPSFTGGVELPDGVTIERVLYSEATGGVPVELLVCRHCLEHIDDPVGFLRMVRANLAGRGHTVLFFEVPSFLSTLREGGIWDLIYEHCSYFTPSSLARAFDVAGVHVTEVSETFGNQYLTIHALVLDAGEPRPIPARGLRVEPGQDVADWIRRLASRYEATVAHWRELLDELARQGRRVVVWGAGSKGTAFLNAVHPHGRVEHVVDISPLKRDKFIPVTGQRIVAPEQLRTLRPDVVLLMNPIYHDEVASALGELGVEATILQAVDHDPEETEGQRRATGS